MAQPPPRPPDGQKKIPSLTHIAPAIFTPISGDELLQPFNPPSNRVERLQAKLEALETNRRRVRANMLYLYRRECARLVQEGQAREQAIHPSEAGTVPPISDEELEEMVANMSASVPDGEEPEQKPVAYSVMGPPDFSKVVEHSLREEYTTALERTLSKGLTDLKGYEAHVATIRNAYKQALERELHSAMDLD